MATCMRQKSKARHIAYGALTELFPDARKQSIARLCGYPTPSACAASLIMARKGKWWREEWVDEVAGALLDRFPEISPANPGENE